MSAARLGAGSMPTLADRRRARRQRMNRPEESVRLRVIVLAATELSVLTVAVAGAVDAATAVVGLLLVPIGSWFAYRRRRHRNILLKVLLAAGLVAALAQFLQRARTATSVDDARVMLGGLFVWVQVLHSFDLPRRRDLAFSMAATVVLVAEAGSLSIDTGFGLLLLPYLALCAAWLYRSDRVRAEEDADPYEVRAGTVKPSATARRSRIRSLAGGLGAALLASMLVFMFTPHVPGARVLAPPFSVVNPVAVPGFSGGVSNPDAEGGDGSGPVRGVGYPGFGTGVDLRVRGHLSNQLVMRVRSPQPAFWRGQAYDTFNGTTWSASDHVVTEYGEGDDRSIDIGSPETSVPTRTLLQTFYVVRRQPNIVFAAANVRQVFFPASRVAVDEYGSIRAPIMLEPDTVYSVISDVPNPSGAMLRAAPAPQMGSLLSQYTQLPPDLPARDVELAHRITDPWPDTYDKVMAVQRWLQRNTRYNLDIPPDPPGVDAVDEFLFVRRQGFCEHIASAMAILLRAVGIPTRFAVGFDVGSHNLLTGYYDVHESDAHAWVEVAYPGIGWMEYDPTHAVPPAAQGFGASFLAGELLARLGRFVAWVVPGPLKTAGEAVGHALAVAGRSAARAWPVLLAVALAGIALLAWLGRRRGRVRSSAGAVAAFEAMSRTFERRGHPRKPEQTPAEYLRELLRTDPVARAARTDVEVVVAAFERDRFAASPPDPVDVEHATSSARRVAEAAGRR
ncbi:MAG TPA: transglutaminaseTgpA domain-containing protein [Actinomycetota bacterium]